MSVWISNKKLIPGPLVNINKEANFTADGRHLSSMFNIELHGTILPNKGSPRSVGWWISPGDPPDETFVTDATKFNSILQKQELIREALRPPGFEFKYAPPGLKPVICYPIVKSINFNTDVWVTKCDYTILLQAAELNRQGSQWKEDDITAQASGLFLSSVSDNFTVQERPDFTGVFDIIRNVSATAFTAYGHEGTGTIIGSGAWLNAKQWVQTRINSYPLGSGESYFGLPSGDLFNKLEEENIDKQAGSYSLSQRAIFSPTSYIENRTVSRVISPNTLFDNAPYSTRINVNGTFIGMELNNVPSGKIAAARIGWNATSGTIAASVGALGSPISVQYNEDVNNGTIQYSMEWMNTSGSYYKHNFDVNYSFAPGSLPVLTVQGVVEGLTNDSLPASGGANWKFALASGAWVSVIETGIKANGFAKSLIFGTLTASDYNDVPLTRQISYNEPEGKINYAYTFGHKGDSAGTVYNESYDITFNTTNSHPNDNAGYIVTAQINGQIIGLATAGNINDPSTRFTNAKTGWNNVNTLSVLFNRVNAEYAQIGASKPPLHSGMLTRSVGMDRNNGIITYSATFDNRATGYYPGIVAVQDVNVEDNPRGADVFAVQIIPGRAVGPILQNISTTTERRRTINVALTLHSNGTNHWTWADKSTPATVAAVIISGILPSTGYYTNGDSDNWNFKAGFYTRTYSISYTGG